MTHIGNGPPSLLEVAEWLRPGDILTHCFTGNDMGIADESGRIRPEIAQLQKDGLILDLGHGTGSFGFALAESMLEQGILAEARSVFDRGPDPAWPGLKAHGAPELFAHFRGEIGLDDARRIAIDHTRQYAKRQMTWFRHQITPDLVIDSASASAMPTAEKYLDKFGV